MAGVKYQLDSLILMGKEEAYREVKRLVKKYPNNFDVLMQARKYSMMNGDYKNTIEYLKRAGENLPLDSDMDMQLQIISNSWTKVGDKFYRIKDYNKALFCYEESNKLNSNYLNLYNALIVAEKLNDKKLVLKYGEQLLREYPDKSPWDVKKKLVLYYEPTEALHLMIDYPALLKARDKTQISIFLDNYAKVVSMGSPIAQNYLKQAYAIFASAKAAWPKDPKIKNWNKAFDRIAKVTERTERVEWNQYSRKPGSYVSTPDFIQDVLNRNNEEVEEDLSDFTDEVELPVDSAFNFY